MKRTFTIGLTLAAVALTVSLAAQTTVPEIAFDSNADMLKMPPNTFLGEVAGVRRFDDCRAIIDLRVAHGHNLMLRAGQSACGDDVRDC